MGKPTRGRGPWWRQAVNVKHWRFGVRLGLVAGVSVSVRWLVGLGTPVSRAFFVDRWKH